MVCGLVHHRMGSSNNYLCHMDVSMKCCSCNKELSETETYICQQCSDEIDRRADEVMGNAEDDDDN